MFKRWLNGCKSKKVEKPVTELSWSNKFWKQKDEEFCFPDDIESRYSEEELRRAKVDKLFGLSITNPVCDICYNEDALFSEVTDPYKVDGSGKLVKVYYDWNNWDVSGDVPLKEDFTHYCVHVYAGHKKANHPIADFFYTKTGCFYSVDIHIPELMPYFCYYCDYRLKAVKEYQEIRKKKTLDEFEEIMKKHMCGEQ